MNPSSDNKLYSPLPMAEEREIDQYTGIKEEKYMSNGKLENDS